MTKEAVVFPTSCSDSSAPSPDTATVIWIITNHSANNMPVTTSPCESSVERYLYAVDSAPDPLTLKIQTSLARRQEALREVRSSANEDSSVAQGNIVPRDWQLSAARELLGRRDSFVVTGTGSGKSLCYQLALIASPGKSILAIFPLISLMTDQVIAFISSVRLQKMLEY